MKLDKLIDSGIPILGGALLVVMVTVTFLQIVLREFFDFSLNWSDEIAQFCMTWLAFFGSIWLTKYDRHINTGLKLHQKFNKRLIGLIDGILALVIVGMAIMVSYQSVIFLSKQWMMTSESLPWLKMGCVYFALPLFMLAVVYYYLKSFFKNMLLILKK
jgi:TRAP-type C4-dicarboxylate transport system permease small subunit